MSFNLLKRVSSAIVVLAGCFYFLAPRTVAARESAHWVGTWATALSPGRAGRGGRGPINPDNQTIREIVHTSIGGRRVRAVFSNAFGTAPLSIGAAHIALRQKDAAIIPGSDRALTFGNRGTTTIPAGAIALSDPVDLNIPALSDLAVDLYLPGATSAEMSAMSVHNGAGQTNFVSQPGNFAGKADFPVMTNTGAWYFLQRVEVLAPETVGAVVGFGDSITDGARSTPDTNNRWLDQLARRIDGAPNGPRMAVLNTGIAGNRILADGAGVNALARFDRDVLTQTGITHVIVLHGGNDIGARQNPAQLADVIAAHRQLIDRAHAAGLVIIGATLTPFQGSTLTNWTPEAKKARLAFNDWVRTSKAYDSYIDFDAVLRDPAHPSRLLAQYNSGDNLHPNDAGYQLMGNTVDLKALLRHRAAAR
jgi:lysophospholipase L1-like esterase